MQPPEKPAESPDRPPEDVTRLLADLSAGKQGAGDALLPLVYQELHNLAEYYMRGERPGHTLQATALVHEAFLRLGGGEKASFEDRGHFMRLAARAMRRILIDHARRKKSEKEGGGRHQVTLENVALFMEETHTDLLALDTALDNLSAMDPQLARIVELRFFAGLTVEQTARVLEISDRTVKRDWRTARAWLKVELERKG
jgi:RNA polymerase sigma factor (TIGR02999 family)